MLDDLNENVVVKETYFLEHYLDFNQNTNKPLFSSEKYAILKFS